MRVLFDGGKSYLLLTQLRHFCNCFMTMILSFASHKQPTDDDDLLWTLRAFLLICGRKNANTIVAITRRLFDRLLSLYHFAVGFLLKDAKLAAF